jgi:hypothetical protein
MQGFKDSKKNVLYPQGGKLTVKKKQHYHQNILDLKVLGSEKLPKEKFAAEFCHLKAILWQKCTCLNINQTMEGCNP